MFPRNFAYSVSTSIFQAVMLGFALSQCYLVAENTKIPLPILLAAGDLATKGVLALPEQVIQPTVSGVKNWLKRKKSEERENEQEEKTKRLKVMETELHDEDDNNNKLRSTDVDNDDFEEECSCCACSESDDNSESQGDDNAGRGLEIENDDKDDDEGSAGDDISDSDSANSLSEGGSDEEHSSVSSEVVESARSTKRSRLADTPNDDEESSDESVIFIEKTHVNALPHSESSPARNGSEELSVETTISPSAQSFANNDMISKKTLRQEVNYRSHHTVWCFGQCHYGSDCNEAKAHEAHLARCNDDGMCPECNKFDAFLWKHVRGCQNESCSVPTCAERKRLRYSSKSSPSQ